MTRYLIAFLLGLSPLLASSSPLRAADGFPGAQASVEAKREWLRDKLVSKLTDVRTIRATHDKIDRLDEQQIDALIAKYREQAARPAQAQPRGESSRSATPEQEQQLAEMQAYRDRLVAEYQARLAAARGRPGYAPYITTLPSGASLSASAVVSPDRRYVRIGAMPFFSNVDGYRTFNMATGQMSPLIPVNPYGYGYGGYPAGYMPIPYALPGNGAVGAAQPQYQYRPIRPEHTQPGYR